MDDPSADCRTDGRLPGSRHGWLWILLVIAGIAAVAAAFLGYGQSALLLDAVNLRYCG